LTLPLFCIWNPWWGVVVNAAVALAVNFPCILALRYNRARFFRVIQRHEMKRKRSINIQKP
jgi:hypothetical protein